mgnify:CR=1 FL=1
MAMNGPKGRLDRSVVRRNANRAMATSAADIHANSTATAAQDHEMEPDHMPIAAANFTSPIPTPPLLSKCAKR